VIAHKLHVQVNGTVAPPDFEGKFRVLVSISVACLIATSPLLQSPRRVAKRPSKAMYVATPCLSFVFPEIGLVQWPENLVWKETACAAGKEGGRPKRWNDLYQLRQLRIMNAMVVRFRQSFAASPRPSLGRIDFGLADTDNGVYQALDPLGSVASAMLCSITLIANVFQTRWTRSRTLWAEGQEEMEESARQGR
jgi:hypothetical protein